MNYYIIRMNRGYDEESEYNSIDDLVVTDSKKKAKEISGSLNNLVQAYKNHLTAINKFKHEYLENNSRPVWEKPVFSLKSPPAYDDDKYMTVSKEYFDKYAEHLRLVELAEGDYKLKSDKWLSDLDSEIKQRFSFNSTDFKYHELLDDVFEYLEEEDDCNFYYSEIDFIKS